jgi:hypothetical protein
VNNNFQYNTAVTNVNVTNVHNTYNQTIINNVTVNNTNITRTSYAGGPGTRTHPSEQEDMAVREAHMHATPVQLRHENAAQANPELAATHNQGRPPVAATPHPAALAGPGVIAARPVGPAWRPTAPPAAINGSAHGQPLNPAPGSTAPPARGAATYPAQAPAPYRPQAPAPYRPQAPADYRPQAPAPYRPQAPADYHAQAPATNPAHGPAAQTTQAGEDHRPHPPAATSDRAVAAPAPYRQPPNAAQPPHAAQPAQPAQQKETQQNGGNGKERPKHEGDRPAQEQR